MVITVKSHERHVHLQIAGNFNFCWTPFQTNDGNIFVPHRCCFVHRWPADSPHQGPAMRKALPIAYRDVIMVLSAELITHVLTRGWCNVTHSALNAAYKNITLCPETFHRQVKWFVNYQFGNVPTSNSFALLLRPSQIYPVQASPTFTQCIKSL